MTVIVAPALTDEVILANRAKWTAALRSGEYQQTKGKLATKEYDAYCCLGVACEVIGPAYGVRRELRTNEDDSETYSFDNPEYMTEEPSGDHDGKDIWGEDQVLYEYGELPAPLYAPLGLTVQFQNELATMNDDQDKDFAAIADRIDRLPVRRDRWTWE